MILLIKSKVTKSKVIKKLVLNKFNFRHHIKKLYDIRQFFKFLFQSRNKSDFIQESEVKHTPHYKIAIFTHPTNYIYLD